MAIEDTLTDRGAEYGDVKRQASLAESIKLVMENSENWHRLTPVQRQSLDLIALKISRLLCGNPNNVDSWHDIGGYAKLGENDARG